MSAPYEMHVPFHAPPVSVKCLGPVDVTPAPAETNQTDTTESTQNIQDELADDDATTRTDSQAAELARLEGLLEEIIDCVCELDTDRGQSLAELQQVAVELAVAVASHLVKEKLTAEELNVGPLVEEAISRLQPNQPLVILLHSSDKAALEAAWQDKFTAAQPQLTLAADDRLPPGSVRATAGDWGLLSTLEQRLATIRESLLQGIEYAQVERRKTDPGAGSLRRFPDRRQTA